MRGSVTRLVAVLTCITAVVALVVYLASRYPSYGFAFRYVYAGTILVVGVVVTRELSLLVTKKLGRRLGRNAFVAGNGVEIVGYIATAAVAAFYASFSPTAILASAAFGGLVLGLALQPTLGSFFSGILLLVSGEMRPGSQVRILSWHIPFQWAFTPGYKYFSPDQVYPGYMAEVLEVGLFFTTVLTEEGQVMRIPNSILATDAAVIRYTDVDFIFNVRYEFPNRLDPELVVQRVKEETKDFPVLNVYVNEQSDKEYYIVKVVLNAKGKDHAELKSRILTRFIRLHRSLIQPQTAAG